MVEIIIMTQHFTFNELAGTWRKDMITENKKHALAYIDNLQLLAEVLEDIRAILKTKVFISSGFRYSVLNEKVGGAKNSYHTKGLAADFSAFGIDTKCIFEILLRSNIKNLRKVILEEIRDSKWIHISVENNPDIKTQYFKTKGGGRYERIEKK